MSEPVNLNKARKARERAARKAQADANAARHGQSKAERLLAASREVQARARLEAHRRDGDDEEA